MTQNKSKTIMVRVSDNLKSEAKRQAEQNGLDLSNYIRHLITINAQREKEGNVCK